MEAGAQPSKQPLRPVASVMRSSHQVLQRRLGWLEELQAAGAGVSINHRGLVLKGKSAAWGAFCSPQTGCLEPFVGVTEGLPPADCIRLDFSWLYQLTLNLPLTEEQMSNSAPIIIPGLLLTCQIFIAANTAFCYGR